MSVKRCKNFIDILMWSAYFTAIVYFIILHPCYVDHFHDPLPEIQKLVISIIMFLIFVTAGLFVRAFECFKK